MIKKIQITPLILSIVSSIGLILSCYFIDNQPYSLGGANIGQHIEQLKLYFGDTVDNTPNDFFLVNIAFDRQLVPINYSDEIDLPKGNIDITDRYKLTELLRKLKNTEYKYIILDILFDKREKSPADSTLFSLIASMNNIIVAKTQTASISNEIPSSKLRNSDYSAHIMESNFVKYEYLINGEPSLPYQVYEDIYGKKITSLGWFYFFDGLPAYKSVILRHPMKLWNELKLNKTFQFGFEPEYFNLGSDILEPDIDLSQEVRNKIIVIGDFCENDIHDTYIGPIAGPVILLNAFTALVNNDITIPIWLIIFLFIFYSVVSYCIICRLNTSFIFRKIKSKTTLLLLSFISISTLMSIVAAVIYILFEVNVNVLLPSLYFTALITLFDLPKRINRIKNI